MEYLTALDMYNDNEYLFGGLFLLSMVARQHILEEPAGKIRDLVRAWPGKYATVFATSFVATRKISRALLLTLLYAVIFDLILEPSAPAQKTNPQRPQVTEPSPAEQVMHAMQPMPMM
jgi:hypothetical protein